MSVSKACKVCLAELACAETTVCLDLSANKDQKAPLVPQVNKTKRYTDS